MRKRMWMQVATVLASVWTSTLLAPGAEAQSQRAAAPKVIWGTPAEAGAYPWMVSVRIGGVGSCGGALIDSTWIVTAAHCVVSDTGVTAAPAQVQVQIGLTDVNADRSSITVEQVLPHPDYGVVENAPVNDIALLRLPASMAPRARSFLQRNQSTSPARAADVEMPGARATVVGYGGTTPYVGGATTLQNPYHPQNHSAVFADQLMQAELSLIGLEECRQRTGASTASVDQRVICARGTVRREDWVADACHGDSGGPLFVNHPTDPGRKVLVGIVSWGPGCGDPRHAGVYTRVSSFVPWLRSMMTAGQQSQ